jgi:hypothetical protein
MLRLNATQISSHLLPLDTSVKEEDTCISYEEEDACLPPLKRRLKVRLVGRGVGRVPSAVVEAA